MAFTRRDIWNLEDEQEWHPVTEAYARAVGRMQDQPASEVTSWSFQAAIHESSGGDWRQQCQHNCWFFLPWHRMYLYWFERIVRAAMNDIPEIDAEVRDAWALPYWNYSRGGKFAALPKAFRAEKLSDGVTDNPLFVADRKQRINDGKELLPRAIATKAALAAPTFADPGDGGFGGAPTGKNHFAQDPAAVAGRLELTPHGSVHNGVGGLMAAFDTAGLDPVFWMHHANIDRLWAVWLAMNGNVNPGDDPWKTTEFEFHDEEKQLKRSRAAGVLDTIVDLGYTYEDLTAPPAAERVVAMTRGLPPEHPPELVGATATHVDLTGTEARVTFAVEPPSGPAARGERAEPARVILNLEGVVGERNPGITYAVFVNLPDDGDPDTDETHYVGNVSFFGIEASRDVRSDHPGGHGVRYAFDITDTVAELRAADRWNPAEITVTFAPLEEPSEVEAASVPVRVGRVGLYVQ